MNDKLSALFETAGFTLTEKNAESFSLYAKMLVEWNEKINLTAITDEEGIFEKHFLDSILPLSMMEIPEGARLIDVGTGAGFPSIPMKIMRDDLEITLLDSLYKRLRFLSELTAALEIKAKRIHSRAEEGSRNEELREKFDVATARAVAALPVLAEYCLPYVKKGGIFLALKGPNEEIAEARSAIKILGGEVEEVKDYELPCGDKRRLIVIRKQRATPTKYPRTTAKIKNEQI